MAAGKPGLDQDHAGEKESGKRNADRDKAENVHCEPCFFQSSQ